MVVYVAVPMWDYLAHKKFKKVQTGEVSSILSAFLRCLQRENKNKIHLLNTDTLCLLLFFWHFFSRLSLLYPDIYFL